MSTAEPIRVGEISIEDKGDLRLLSDDDVVAINAFDNIMQAEARPDDPPRPVELTASNYRHIPTFVVVREWWARDGDGDVVASANVSWTTTEDNRHLVRSYIGVRPGRRRQGIARSMLRLLADATAAEGRRLLISTTIETAPAGAEFCRRLEAESAFASHTNRLLISDVDTVMLDEWIESGPIRAPGYSLVWVDGACPDDLLDQVVAVFDVMNTAPRGDLDMEDQIMEAPELRQWEESAAASGDELWAVYVRHDATGELVGYTQVAYHPKLPHTVFQYGTAVRPDHRGHALGKWAKAVMLKRIMVERDEVKDIRTGNADSNAAMLGINHALGFEPFMAETGWQVSLESVERYLAGSSV